MRQDIHIVMKEEKPKLIRSIPSVRTPRDFMGNEIPVPNKENSPNEDRVKIVNQKHKDKQNPLLIKQKKTKTKNKK